MTKNKYKNPCYDSTNKHYGPKHYETDVKPITYRGFQIYHRIKATTYSANVCDIVINNICIMSRVTIKSCKKWIDGFDFNQTSY